jgi:hypothetical protein
MKRAKKIGLCNWCGATGPLVKSHIIAKSFFRIIQGDEPHAFLMQSNEKPINRDVCLQAGVYDDDLLCEPCEAIFSEWDRYGYEVLGKISLSEPVTVEGKETGHLVKCDTDKIKRFVLSVLWRASVSRHHFYSSVQLGPYENLIKERLLDPQTLRPEEFPVLITRAEGGTFDRHLPMLIAPIQGRTATKHNLHSFYLPNGVKITVITDRRPLPNDIGQLVISKPDHFFMPKISKKVMHQEHSYIASFEERIRFMHRVYRSNKK